MNSIDRLLWKRQFAKEARHYELAEALRIELMLQGVDILDTADGFDVLRRPDVPAPVKIADEVLSLELRECKRKAQRQNERIQVLQKRLLSVLYGDGKVLHGKSTSGK